MAVAITEVRAKSAAAAKRITAGDSLCAINGHPIRDVLDYQFYARENTLTLTLRERSGRYRLLKLRKAEGEDLGLEFASYLMDKQRPCANKCIFCFVDQLPKGLRESLYFKDDDARLSFLFGNYITLTNLKHEEIRRIIEMRISPINISVHTMNPALRVKMMGNPRAGETLSYMTELAAAGISMNTQLVLCPGINDGAELRHSLEKLAVLTPALQSIAAVPVGLTRYREALTPLTAFTEESAKSVIREISDFNSRILCYNKGIEEPLAFAADEFYLKAGEPIPLAAHYGDFHQLENGVGMWALLREEFHEALAQTPPQAKRRAVSIATGVSAFPLLQELADAACARHPGLTVSVYPIINHFFGEQITVTGLLTGGDLQKQLQGKALGEELVLSCNTLRREGDLFLDGLPPAALEEALGVPLRITPNDGAALLDAMLGKR